LKCRETSLSRKKGELIFDIRSLGFLVADIVSIVLIPLLIENALA